MSWSIRSRGYVARTQKIIITTRYVFPRNSATPAAAGRSPNGQLQPPRNSSAATAPITNVLTYSARKKIAQWAPLYSTNGPPTISDSAEYTSKGVRPTSASPATKKTMNPSGWMTMNGTVRCASTTTTKLIESASIATVSTVMMIGIS